MRRRFAPESWALTAHRPPNIRGNSRDSRAFVFHGRDGRAFFFTQRLGGSAGGFGNSGTALLSDPEVYEPEGRLRLGSATACRALPWDFDWGPSVFVPLRLRVRLLFVERRIRA